MLLLNVWITSRKCHKMMNILTVEVSQNVVVIVHLCPYDPKYWNIFKIFFKLVSNNSVAGHAHLAPLFVLVLLWIITVFLLKLYISATVPLGDTVVLSWTRHIRLTSIDASKWYWDVNSLYRNMMFPKCSAPVCSCIVQAYSVPIIIWDCLYVSQPSLNMVRANLT
jgi:hypothetical protein